MKSVLVYALLLALGQYGAAVNVCNNEVSYTSTLTTPCLGNDKTVLWPNYNDPTTYYKCIGDGKAVLINCPPGTYFTYYFQSCTDCKRYIPSPKCETLQQTTDVTCASDTKPTPSPTTIKTTTSTTGNITDPITKPTRPTKPTPATKPPTSTPSAIPTPPSEGGDGDIPMPPVVVTPPPNIPTPPNENVTPPSIPGTPPMLTTVASA